jgi:uncharacterized protein YydD (DUF2326 family)
MLKLSKIYSDSESIFPKIKFHDGLNIVFASVSKGSEKKDSHSLGKTILADLLDYMLLKEPKKGFFIKRPVFSNFLFYLEIQTSEQLFVTIRRKSGGKIFIQTSSKKTNLLSLKDKEWEHSNLGVRTAKQIFNEILFLNIVKKIGFSFRNGLRYCLRRQTQYEKTFKVNTSREGDLYWKPYLAGILGIDSQLVTDKYKANKTVDNIDNAIKEIKELPQVSSQSLEAEIAQIEKVLLRMEKELDDFDFSRSDIEISKELVDDVSVKISELNSTIYIYDQRIAAIEKSLKAEFTFDLDKILEIYNEIQLFMPDQLIKSYEELIELNKQMTKGRKHRLKKAKLSLVSKRDKTVLELEGLNQTLQKLSKMLVEKKAFDKYKSLQKRFNSEEVRLAILKERLQRLDSAEVLYERLDDANKKKEKLGKKVVPFTRVSNNRILKQAVGIFGEYVDDVLGVGAFFFVKNNKEGNLSFEINLKDQTSVSDGFSYTRVLSALFDLTFLSLYNDQQFYKFIYHDGLLESLDDRVKIRLLKLWRTIGEKYGLQLIISVLDSDIPINNKMKKEYFKQSEIIRELHDRGDDGRLFKMPAF